MNLNFIPDTWFGSKLWEKIAGPTLIVWFVFTFLWSLPWAL